MSSRSRTGSEKAAGVEDAGAILEGEVVLVGACREERLFVEHLAFRISHFR